MDLLVPKAILFDVGMTLVHLDCGVVVEALAREGIAPASVQDAVGGLLAAFPARHMRIPEGRDDIRKIGLTWAALMDTPPEKTCRALREALEVPGLYNVLDPDAHSVLRKLRDMDVRLGVVSNSDGTLDEELESYDLLRYFDATVDSTDYGLSKPQPEIFQEALKLMHLDGADCWYVGDNLINDVLGAKAARFAETVLYDRFNVYSHIPGIPVIGALGELPALISRRGDSAS